MTGPKHLWSGDWQTQSADLPTEPGEPGEPAAPVADPASSPPPARRPLRPTWRLILPAAVVVLAVAVALAALLPGSRPGEAARGGSTPAAGAIPNPVTPTPGASPTGTPTTGLTGRTVNWLGMQISTVQNVGAVIQTVQLGSPADAAGLDPGDIIQTVNRRTILVAAQIRGAVSGLRTGQAVDISVDRGSTQFSTVAAFAGQPTTSP